MSMVPPKSVERTAPAGVAVALRLRRRAYDVIGFRT
jgi:hypothetical protein